MTAVANLPATYASAVEAEALMLAREMIAGFGRGNPWSNDPALSAEAGQAVFGEIKQLAKQITVQLASQSVSARMRVIDAAKAGDPDAIAVLEALLLECKSKRLEMAEWPTELIAYDMWLTSPPDGRRPRQRGRPGPKKVNYLSRDLHIAYVVWAVIDRFGRHGITATGRSARKLSACAIVAIALRQEAKLNIEYDEVKKIWGRYGRFYMSDWPPGP